MEIIKLTKEESFIVKSLIDSAKNDLEVSADIDDIEYHTGRVNGMLEMLDLLQFELKIIEVYKINDVEVQEQEVGQVQE